MEPNVQTGTRGRLSPQCIRLLDHLRRTHSITNVEAQAVYRIRALPRRIGDLRAAGFVISRAFKQDLTGQRYVRYYLGKPAD